jgi:hypothetical protein
LKTELANRKTLEFIPIKAREELDKLNDDSSKGVHNLILKFYNFAV